MLADCLSTSSVVWTYTGEHDQAIGFSQEAFQISHSINNLWGQSYSQHWVGKAHWERGQPDQAISVMEESIRLGELAGFASPQATVRASLANVVGSLGDIERGLKIAQLARGAGGVGGALKKQGE